VLTVQSRCSLGVAISSPPIVQILNNIKAPYNVSTPTASLALRALSPAGLSQFYKNISTLKENRSWLTEQLLSPQFKKLGILGILGKPHANFLLVQIGSKEELGREPDNKRSEGIYKWMAEKDQVVVRFRGNELGCKGCLRVTVGTREECESVVEKLRAGLERD